VNRPLYRIRQYLATRKSKLSYLEIDFVRKYLNHQEQILFFRMKGFDQRHGITVANKCLEKTLEVNWINKTQMARVALLHDIGKSSADIGVNYRVLYVLLGAIAKGKLLKSLAKKNSRIALKRKLFVLDNHGLLGAKMLMDVGCTDNEVLQVVAKHHDTPEVGESKLLPFLREIDATL